MHDAHTLCHCRCRKGLSEGAIKKVCSDVVEILPFNKVPKPTMAFSFLLPIFLLHSSSPSSYCIPPTHLLIAFLLPIFLLHSSSPSSYCIPPPHLITFLLPIFILHSSSPSSYYIPPPHLITFLLPISIFILHSSSPSSYYIPPPHLDYICVLIRLWCSVATPTSMLWTLTVALEPYSLVS